ncbi:MAG: GIY-YIG nuclease family protein [Gammaproteobacteria bacterium]
MADWYVYILRCADNSLYTGTTTDVPRRLDEHNTHNRLAAAYTRGRRPVKLVYSEVLPSRSDALKREHEIKRLDRADKQRLVRSQRRDDEGFE